MPGTRLSSPDDDAGGTHRGYLTLDARVLAAHAEWQRQLVLASDVPALAEAVRKAPAIVLPDCTLELVPAGAVRLTETSGGAGSTLTVPLQCRGQPAGELRLHCAGGAPQDAVRELLSGIGLCVETALENMERLQEARDAAGGAAHEAYFEQLFSVAPDAIVVLDGEDRVVRVNNKFVEMFGYTFEEAAGRTINELIVPPELQEDAFGLTQSVAGGTHVAAESIRQRKDGSTFHASILGTPVVVRGNQVAVYGIYRDITAQKQAEEALHRLSTTDELTGLFNRRGFFMLAEQQRKVAARAGLELLLLYIDIDDFKTVNDQFGHLEGDRVLADLGRLLQHCYRNSDIVARVSNDEGLMARMGGDEFVVLAINPGPDGERILITRLRERIEEYNDARGVPYRISLSIGAVRVKPDPDSTIDSLLAAADRLMYRDKRDLPAR
jgi:diguanylate cyclase (GGDEF)-like protein/PAS domain S-box-containing protein